MRNKSVQGLRALFAIGVFLSHSYFLKEYAYSTAIFNSFFAKSAVVSFFFMISGFYLINLNKDIKFGAYLKKKILRIYPLHLIIIIMMLTIKILGNAFDFTSFKSWITLILNMCLLQTWSFSLTIATSFNTVAWFLSSLLFCYIVGYWLMKKVSAGETKEWKYTYIIAAILLVFKCIVALYHPNDNTGYYYCYLFPLAGMTDFLIGLIIAKTTMNKEFSDNKRGTMQTLALLAIIITIYLKNYLPSNYCRAFLTIPATALIVTAFAKETRFSRLVFGNKLMVFIGDLSFEFYLIHSFAMSIIDKFGITKFIAANVSPFVALVVNMLLCMLGAFIYKNLAEWTIKKVENIKIKPEVIEYGKQKN